jgi:hypothetical protein
LEARIESARRASEVHKKRTGRSLRVTEQDVINKEIYEEIYDEEDDDLPSQYHLVTAHLQTKSTAFNQRLTAYLTGQVGPTSTVGQYLASSYAQGFHGNEQHQQNQQRTYQNHAIEQQYQQEMAQAISTPMYTHTLYIIPYMQQPMHQRSASVANPEMTSNKEQTHVLQDDGKRRMSLEETCTKTSIPAQPPIPQSSQPSTTKASQAAAPQPLYSQPQ